MTLPLIKVPDHDVQFNFDEIAKRVVDTGGRQVKLRFGTGTLTFTASTDSNNTVVTHGMGSTPISVVAVSNTAPTFNDIPKMNVSALTATTFTINGQKAVANSVSTFYFWLAIG